MDAVAESDLLLHSGPDSLKVLVSKSEPGWASSYASQSLSFRAEDQVLIYPSFLGRREEYFDDLDQRYARVRTSAQHFLVIQVLKPHVCISSFRNGTDSTPRCVIRQSASYSLQTTCRLQGRFHSVRLIPLSIRSVRFSTPSIQATVRGPFAGWPVALRMVFATTEIPHLHVQLLCLPQAPWAF